MRNFFRRLLSSSSESEQVAPESADNGSSHLLAYIEESRRRAEETDTSGYFELMSRMQGAISDRDYSAAAELARDNMRQVPEFVRKTRLEFDEFVIQSIPALQEGGIMLAFAQDQDAIEEMRRIIASSPELEPWSDAPDAHLRDLRLFHAIESVVQKTPGILQTSMKERLGEADGRRIGTLISWLEKGGRIERTKEKRTYRLWPAGQAEVALAPPRRSAPSLERRGEALKATLVDVNELPYVPLPRAPLKWEERDSGHVPEAVVPPSEPFEVRDAPDWSLVSVEKVPMEERPDTSYRQFHPMAGGLILLDDLGKAEAFPHAPASALRFDRQGRQVAAAPLGHDPYRVGVNALGRGLIAMSSECVLHAYDEGLEPLFESDLATWPEMADVLARIETPSDRPRNFVRAVSLAHDNSRILITAIDEAWCISGEGEALWRLKLPLKEGWREVSPSEAGYGTDREVGEALETLDLALPVTPEDVKRRYRALAKEWHPDLNPNKPEAEERMKALTAAAELLTGADLTAVLREVAPRFVKEETVFETEFGTVSISLGSGGLYAADWIYAAAMAGRSYSAFLAGYSGRVIEVSPEGVPVRAYDIGSVPKQIIDTDDFLYILTDTRLYVLQDEALHALIDTLEVGDIMVTPTGFGLVEKKRFRWFSEDGRLLGTVVTNNPIRRVYSSEEGLVIETRQRKATIAGATRWWD